MRTEPCHTVEKQSTAGKTSWLHEGLYVWGILPGSVNQTYLVQQGVSSTTLFILVVTL